MKIYQYCGKCNVSGKNIRRIREARGITQEQLAARMQVEGIPIRQKTISRIEDGSRVVPDYELTALSKALCVDVAELLKE
ncbi:MAG: helix-turn-helix transcriptional regulator [Oscillospiraceae bacterium]|nr:helix-turn-helix transcriptional regulator [Oscillospiraceae bacterium]